MTEQKPATGNIDAKAANEIVKFMGYENLRLDEDGYWIADDPDDNYETVQLNPMFLRALSKELKKYLKQVKRKPKGFGR